MVLLLLQLSQKAACSEDKRVKCGGVVPEDGKGRGNGCGLEEDAPPPSNEESCYPLMPFLRRLGAVATPQNPHSGSRRTEEVGGALARAVMCRV